MDPYDNISSLPEDDDTKDCMSSNNVSLEDPIRIKYDDDAEFLTPPPHDIADLI